LKLWINREQ